MPRPPPTGKGTGALARLQASLTGRDLEALRHLAAGRSTPAIAAAMAVSTNTVRTRIHRLQNKLGAPTRDQVVPRARAFGLLDGWPDPVRSRSVTPSQRGADDDPDHNHCTSARLH